MHELESCETCRWWVPDPGTPPPVPRLNQFQPGECRMRSLGRPKRSDGWCDRWTVKQTPKEKEKKE